MGVWSRLHAASAVALLPALAFAPVVGALALGAWLALSRPSRPAPSRDAALVLAVAVAVLALVHGGDWSTAALIVVAGAAIAAAVVRLDASPNRAASIAAGVGASTTAFVLATLALAEAAATGFGQVATATHHPNATAALALALVGGSALAWRGPLATRALGGLGVAAGLSSIALTGSRGGLVGLAVALGVLVVVWLGRRLVLAGRVGAGRALAAAGTLLLLVCLQSLLFAPERIAPWLPTGGVAATDGAPVAGESGASANRGPATLLERVLRDPLATSGGRRAAWQFAREMIATRPLLGFGFDAIERAYAPAAAAALSEPLMHPHHGVLALLLVGGSLLTVALLALVGTLVWRALSGAVHGDATVAVVAAAFVGLLAMDLLDSTLHLGAVGGVALVVLVMAIGSTGVGRPPAAPGERTSDCVAPTTRPRRGHG